MPHISKDENYILELVLSTLKDRHRLAIESVLDPSIIPDHSLVSMYAGRGYAYQEMITTINELMQEYLNEEYED
jgi:hypothetical protein